MKNSSVQGRMYKGEGKGSGSYTSFFYDTLAKYQDTERIGSRNCQTDNTIISITNKLITMAKR